MFDYGKLYVKGEDKKDFCDTYYVTATDSRVVIDKNRPMPFMGDSGKIKVYHDGLYFGTPEGMEQWLADQVFDHLVDNSYLIKDGETVMGETCWKLQPMEEAQKF